MAARKSAAAATADPPVETVEGELTFTDDDAATVETYFVPYLSMSLPGKTRNADGVQVVASAGLEPDKHVRLLKYAVDDWRLVEHGQDPETATVHGNMQAAWYQLVLAFRSAGLAWWTRLDT